MSYQENNVTLSVIVPNYNNSKYLCEAIDSILLQTYKNLEIIIIDDLSSDGSQSIIQRYVDQYNNVRAIFNKSNGGVARSRVAAIEMSRGEYITTLDSDDFFISINKLEKEMELIFKGLMDGVSNIISFSNIILVDIDGVPLFPNAKNKILQGDILKNIFCRDCMIPRDFIVSKEQYKAVGGYDTSIPIYEDWDLKLRLAKHNKFYCTDVDGVAYRRHGEGLSSVSSFKHIFWIKSIYNKNKVLVDKDKRKLIKLQLDAYLIDSFASSRGFLAVCRRLIIWWM